MSVIDAERVGALATRLGISPRQLLALAARVAEPVDTPLDAVRLDAELARVRAAPLAAESAADLALLGYASFALDDIDNALRLVWAESGQTGP